MGGVVLECAQFGDFDTFDVSKSDLGAHFGNLQQANYVLNNMLSAEPNQMQIIQESDDLCKYGVTTWIQRVC